MSDHLSRTEIDRYYQRSLSDREIISVSRHLETCEACRTKIVGSHMVDAAFTALGASLERAAEQERFHLTPELSLAYLNGDTGEIETELVESHVEDCGSCAAELQDLRGFEFQQGKSSRRQSDANPWKIIKGLGESVTSWRVVQATTLLVILILIATAVSVRNQIRGFSERLAELESRNNALQQEIASLSTPKERELDPAMVGPAGPQAEIIAALHDAGKLVTLDRDGELSGLVSLPEKYEKIVREMLSTGEAPISSDVTILGGKGETLMGTTKTGQPFHLDSPVGVVVLESRPTFRWSVLDGASAYVVDVFDSESNRVASSGEIHVTMWTPPKELERQRIYIWQVTAVKDGKEVTSPAPPAPQAKFKILGRGAVEEIKRAKNRYAMSHLVLGGIYTQTGLLGEAERELRLLVSANADSSIAHRLLQSVQSSRH